MARPIDDDDEPGHSLAHWKAQREGAKQNYNKVLNERQNDLLDANGKYGPRSSFVKNAKMDLEEAEMQRHEIYGVIRRPLNRLHFRWRSFVVLALLLALLEGSVNKFLFDVALQSFGFVSYATSFVLAFFMLIMAHAAGKSLRQVWSEYRRRIVWQSLGVFLVMTLLLFIIISVLTVGRALTSANTGIANFEEMFSAATASVDQVGLWGTLAGAFSDLSALVLATVNFAGIFAAMMLAFFTHDPDKDFDAAATKVELHRAQLDKLDKRYNAARKKVVSRYRPDLSAIGTRYKAANNQVIELKHRLGHVLDADDRLMIDDWDQLAETSEVGDPQANRPQSEEERAAAEANVTPFPPADAKRA